MSAPDVEAARALYRREAADYEYRTARWQRYRRRAIERLLLGSGDTVIDVACGTGVNLELLVRYVGPRGRVVGVDASAEMLSVARERVEAHQWRNVELIESPVEEAQLPAEADAALFSLTHDVLRSPVAVARVMVALKPGGRFASFGAKWLPWWLAPLNPVVWLVARRYVTTFDGFAKPWEELERFSPVLEVERVALGGGYIAFGRHGAGNER